jgi:anti-sigma factor RsiW
MPVYSAHEPDDVLEAYVRGKLRGLECDRVETHLLRCDTCVDRAADRYVFVQAMRAALREPVHSQVQ